MDGDDQSTVVRPVRIARGRDRTEVACIEVLAGNSRGTILPLTTGSTVIGRGSRCDLPLTDDGVSRRHAKLAISEEGVTNLIDLDSTNGTYVNGAPIDLAIVREGDRIHIGPDAILRFIYRKRQALAKPNTKEVAAALGLRPRELEVAVLVAEGLTSQEVASRLHISPRTVTTHLSNIYERLQLSGRAALARYVVQQGLMPSPGEPEG
ncbi:MAG: FHA domain-containing protein [Deltaproteobacteria bacterium]|nr:FHA domain-containing protein [Deltaproteobacteria bacterium]